ncbi:MAG: thermonuclease family protein [Rickettsiales bacterium]|nr:thermonuclease family protein [Rickettsiales bacterium]
MKVMLYNIRFILCCVFFIITSVIIFYSQNNNKSYFFQELIKNKSSIIGKARIIDGDSLIISKNEIRLQDIDAPEYKQQCSDKNYIKYDCGIDALIYLKKLTNGNIVKCKISGKDFYNRYLGTCYVNEKNLNKLMIRSGNAIKFGADSKYYQDELYAKVNKYGIWQGDFITPRQYRKNNK